MNINGNIVTKTVNIHIPRSLNATKIVLLIYLFIHFIHLFIYLFNSSFHVDLPSSIITTNEHRLTE